MISSFGKRSYKNRISDQGKTKSGCLFHDYREYGLRAKVYFYTLYRKVNVI